ncbi:peptide ABC transporter substrate-binding protein [Bacterioplanes sanyensis]|uniref:Peptide ABC transporter substrate-binding protein n=1 Tax=Bacterioplanes sanyensis TaxID=1249553 RepID=A0A222FJ08_9GAMM|nr:DUF1302 domain-containing protein [Bacterioplanes sanyensis]ASP38576.1 peptide ABC transporter substrate-binding protein [Bacterioplanes sanyensis]
MTSKAKQTVFKKAPLALALMGAIQAQALEFNFGDVNAQWDNTVSYGIGWRVEDRDEYQIMPGNGGKGSSYNYDDGTLNYDKGDIYTHVLKWSSDLEISYENYGAFFRARAYYDAAIMDEDTDFKPLIDETKDAAGKGAELQDAYVWADYYLGDAPVSLRAGRQVVSWGESTFIQGGINSINPVDASAFRKPGAEVKEGLLPVNMLYTSIGLTTNVSLEAFYQLEWEKTRSDPCGTFFSTVDFVADGCGPVVLGGDADERDMLEHRQWEIDTNVPMTERVAPITERLSDNEAKDSGQYGMALRWYAEELGDTEFGFYYMNIHSRLPYIFGAVSNQDRLGAVDGVLGGGSSDPVNENASYNSYRPVYQIGYPEDLKITGISFATSTESGASISGEISYKPDAPVQWNAFELILAGNAVPWSRLYQQRAAEAGGTEEARRSLYGELSQGYDEFDIWQIQSTYIKFFDRVMGADRVALIAEAGLTYVDGLPDTDEARYGRSGAYGIGNNDGVFAGLPESYNPCTADFLPDGTTGNSSKNTQTKHCTDDGYTTELSAGIRARVSATYNNMFSGVNVTPQLSIAYDEGNAPEPGGQFVDGRLTTGLGVNFVYLNQTSFDVSYTNFSGGDYNQLKDRDNITFSAKYSF